MANAENRSVSSIRKLVRFANTYIKSNSKFTDARVVKAFSTEFDLKKTGRSVFTNGEISFRFSESESAAFSNTVLGLSTLRLLDVVPFVVCVVASTRITLLLANSTFIRKISHSSRDLRVDHIRGSFQGPDILREFEDVSNSPENFEQLFLAHLEFTWDENIARIVESTNKIVGSGSKFSPNPSQAKALDRSISLTKTVTASNEYAAVGSRLDAIVQDAVAEILKASRIDNVNLRGNRIEEIISKAANDHGISDLQHMLADGTKILIDIKSKMLDLKSSPKAYNIDKVLAALASGAVMCCYLVGVDRIGGVVKTRLISIFDSTVITNTRIQHHWAGRNSRGVTQFSPGVAVVLDKGFAERINAVEAKAFLRSLIAR